MTSYQHSSHPSNLTQKQIRDGRRVARLFAINAAWSLAGVGLSRTLVLAGTMLVARALGSQEFGRLAVAASTASLVTAVGGLGLGVAVTKYVAQYRRVDAAKAHAVAEAATRIVGAALVLLCGLGMGAARPIAEEVFADARLTNTVRLAVLWAACGAVFPVQTAVLAGLERFKDIALLNLLRGMSTAAFQLGGAYILQADGAIAGAAVAEITTAIVAHWLMWRRCEQDGLTRAGHSDTSITSSLLKFGLATWVGGLAASPALWLCQVLIVRLPNGLHEAGIFEAANKWALSLLLLPTAVGAVQLPVLSRLAASSDMHAFRRVRLLHIAIILGATGVPAIVMVALSEQLMGLAGREYRAGGHVLAVLAIGSVAAAFNTSFGQSLMSKGLVRIRLVADVGLAALLVVIGSRLIPTQGSLGFAYAQLAAYGVVVCVLALIESRIYRQTKEGLSI